ncbi:hypothetical protein ScPMuIL_007440 [Solemya velum]
MAETSEAADKFNISDQPQVDDYANEQGDNTENVPLEENQSDSQYDFDSLVQEIMETERERSTPENAVIAELPVEDQPLYSGPGVYELVCEKRSQRRRKYAASAKVNIEDVYDGILYKEHFYIDGYFRRHNADKNSPELHLSLQINNDGVAIFRSSKFGVWPVYAVINKLLPEARFTRENRIFLGLWYGYQKPHMKLFLGSVLHEIDQLYKGIIIPLKAESMLKVRTIIPSSVADAPARCLMMELAQFNGKFGCPCCYAPGETHAISETGNSHIHPFYIGEDQQETGYHGLRTHQETVKYVMEVEKIFLDGKRREPIPVKGVKEIVYFVQCATESGYKYCAYVKPLEMIDSDSHIVKVKFSIGYKAISLDEIEDPVVFLKTDYDHNYISKFPNFFEKD